MRNKCIIDACSLVYIMQKKINIDSFILNNFIDLNILSSTVDEMYKIGKSRMWEPLKLIIPVIPVTQKGDAAILEYAKSNKLSVITNDRQLIIRLKRENVSCLSISTQGLLLHQFVRNTRQENLLS